jgi:hypothetical protein
LNLHYHRRVATPFNGCLDLGTLAHHGLDYILFLGLSSRVHIELFCAKIPASTFKCLWELELLEENSLEKFEELDNEDDGQDTTTHHPHCETD